MSTGKVAAELPVPKPDICFFSYMNLSSLRGYLMPAWTPSIFSLDHEKLFSRLSSREAEEVCCGAGSEGFCCPTLLLNVHPTPDLSFWHKIGFLAHIAVSWKRNPF
jgi:hypothetical protein